MSRMISAIFDAGVFRPLEPVDLKDGTHVEVQVPKVVTGESIPELGPEELARQQAAIAKFLKEMDSLPDEGPDDGFSGRDHDKVLYGAP